MAGRCCNWSTNRVQSGSREDHPNYQPMLRELKRISSPGLRQYVGVQEIPRVRNGLGMAILSTSKGLMSDREARQTRTGGELLALVW